MTCPLCGARTEILKMLTTHGKTARRLACIRPSCPKRQGFVSIERVGTEAEFRQVAVESEREYRRPAAVVIS
jgi:hypothetical protein